MKTTKFIVGACIALTSIMGMNMRAAMEIKAFPDNAFIEPNASYSKAIDVLANDYFFSEDPNDCTRDELQLTIINTPTKGRAAVTGDNKIEYRPRLGEHGAEIIEYQILCPKSMKSSSAKLYININDKPSVMSDLDCYVDPIASAWGIQEEARSTEGKVSMVSNVLTGDIDGDGKTEIFVFNASDDWVSGSPTMYGATDAVLVYGYDKPSGLAPVLSLKYTIPLPFAQFVYPYGNFAIANVDGDGYGSLFVVFQGDGLTQQITEPSRIPLLIKYKFDPTLDEGQGGFFEAWRVQFSNNYLYKNASPLLTDIMGDGHQQVCVYDKVYDARSGTLLADGQMIPDNPIAPRMFSEYSFGRFGHDGSPLQSTLIAGDIDNDGIMELVGGDCVYKVDIQDYTDISKNSFSLMTRANGTGRTDVYDGGTALVDIDLDGNLDVVVTGKRSNTSPSPEDPIAPLPPYYGTVYIYNPRTGEVLNVNEITDIPLGYGGSAGPSMPFVGDLDGDGYPDIALTSFLTLRAYQYDVPRKTITQIWELPTTDASSSTTLSLFDFTQSGKSQLIYRDETDLRIIDGRQFNESGDTISSEDRILAQFENVQSATINEYPIVADIDGDGFAEILVSAADSTTIKIPGKSWDFQGQLRVYGSSETPWAPARPVWNQIAYNPLYVNDDLTIPARPINPATAFISPDGRLDRPFNNFLQQATNLNKEGLMILLGPDLLFDSRVPKRIRVDDDTDELNVTVGIMNQGDATFSGPIKLQMYAYKAATDTYTEVGAPYIYANAAGLKHTSPDNTKTLDYVIPNKSTELPADYDNLVMTINLNTNPGAVTPEFSGSAECHDGLNNFTSGFSLVTGRRVICEGNTETIKITPNGAYTVKWFTTSKLGTPIHTGDSYAVTKNADVLQLYFVETYKTPTSPNPISSIRDTIFVYKSPDSLTWTGKGGTRDWHDHLNWENPDKSYPALANIPRLCTNVLIPDEAPNYPDLATRTNLEATNYEEYLESECNNITFDFGGEITRPDKLHYTKAYVDVIFSSHRWQMFAPPLKDFYTGDIYRANPIPFHDDVKTFTKYWAKRNPMTGYYSPQWTGTYNNPDKKFEPGQAVGVWISDKSISGEANPPRDPFEFSFPKQDPYFQLYLAGTDLPVSDPIATPRVNHHRFIFDGNAEGLDFDLQIDGENIVAGHMALIGNPFMSHLDFDKFYEKNQAYIQDYYSVLDENATMQYYKKGASTLTKNIAPMQAFLVELKVPATKLKANGLMTVTIPGDKLKNAEEVSEGFQLRITATQDEYTNQTFIEFDKNAINTYKAGEDIARLFYNIGNSTPSDLRSLSVYSLTDDGTKVAINKLNSAGLKDKIVPLGIWSPKTSPITINISNIDKVPNNYTLYLYDKLTDLKYNLAANSMKTFEGLNFDKKLFLDNRFFLQFKESTGSSIDEEEAENSITAFVRNSSLHIISSENLQSVEVYNLQGQLLYSARLHSNMAENKLPFANLYIVKIKTDRGVFSKKLLNQ